MDRWAINGSDRRASWKEIDQCENNSVLNNESAMKTFAVSWSGEREQDRKKCMERL
jgi:hypothetical protein